VRDPKAATRRRVPASKIAAVIIALVTVIYALAPLYREGEEPPTSVHHLLHAAVILGGVIVGLLLYDPARARPEREHPVWLVLAIGAPIAAMFLMWPSEYAFLDKHPGGHAIEHLGLVVLGFLTAYAGQRYARGIGWAMSLGLLFMALVAALGFGVSPPPAT
jgi:hypothetical protein